MYTQIKVATLIMNSNLVLPGLTGQMVRRRDTLALYLADSSVASCRDHDCRKRLPTAGSMSCHVGRLLRQSWS